MSTITREQLIEDLKASTQNSRGMFEIGEETICALMSLLTAPPAPVSVPDDVMAAIQKVARIRLYLNDFDGDKRGILDCLSDAEEALIEVVNRRAAMLQGADCNSPDGWVACSERMPDENAEQEVLACFKGGDISTLYYFEGRWDDAYGIVPIRQDVTHWMPMPAAPQQE